MTIIEKIAAVAEAVTDIEREQNEKVMQAIKSNMYSKQHLENMKQTANKFVAQKILEGREAVKQILIPVFTAEETREFSDLEIQNELAALSLTVDGMDVLELQEVYNRVYDNILLRNTLEKIAKKRRVSLNRPPKKRDRELEKLQQERKDFFASWDIEQAKGLYHFHGWGLLMQIEDIFEELENE